MHYFISFQQIYNQLNNYVYISWYDKFLLYMLRHMLSHFRVLFSRTVPTTAAKCCALKRSLHTLALACASFLAATSQQLPACHSCLWEGGPTYVPAMFTVNPAPITWWRELWCANHHLSPTETCLVGSSLDMLSESFSSRWNIFYWPSLLGEQMFSSLVDMFLAAGTVI